MKANHTDITVVLDRSGSMRGIANDTIGGYNEFLDDQRTASGTANITLNQFDHEFTPVYTAKDVQEAPALTRSTFVPRGNTALLDAIGRSIVETGARLSKDPAEKVVFVIITDGHENSSREYTREQIAQMINHQRDKYQWQFVFLAANQDAITVGESMGVTRGNSMTYAANTRGTLSAFNATSSNLRMMRSSVGPIGADAMAYSAQDREEQLQAGADPDAITASAAVKKSVLARVDTPEVP